LNEYFKARKIVSEGKTKSKTPYQENSTKKEGNFKKAFLKSGILERMSFKKFFNFFGEHCYNQKFGALKFSAVS